METDAHLLHILVSGRPHPTRALASAKSGCSNALSYASSTLAFSRNFRPTTRHGTTDLNTSRKIAFASLGLA